jgi:uncharacterized protein (TIGR02145 family)
MKSFFLLVILGLFLTFITISQTTTAQAQPSKRLALVVGNGNYLSSVLANPENDARAMKVALESVGFTVMKYENLNQVQMKKAIDDFGVKLKSNEVGLFFYAGHGIQSKGYNYLIPVDANLQSEQQVEYDCVQADRVLALMEASGSKVNIIILDACRNNPFERSWTRSSTGRGLAFMNAPGGTLIAYSTAPGTTAQDGSGNNSPYTTAFIESAKLSGLTVTQIFQNVTRLVSQKTGKQQIPWISSSLTGDFYFNTGGNATSEFQNEIQVTPINETPALDERDYIIDSRDNERYKTVKIGTQVWMAENLRTTKYRNGDLIGTTATSNISGESSPKYQWACDGNENNIATFGRLYTWFAVTDNRKICPIGWHVPNDAEWTTLTTYLGGVSVAGNKLKETGTTHWQSPNTGATNETGFTALPSSFRHNGNAGFGHFGQNCIFWSSTEKSILDVFGRFLYFDESSLIRAGCIKYYGVSVRCLRD